MKLKMIMLLLAIPLIFSGCAKKNTDNLYLSIVTEPITQDVSGEEMSVYCYDFNTKKLNKIADLNKHDFRNPVYSKKENVVYYIKDNSANSNDADLYSMNVDTKESRQLTEGMKIYSEIIPAKDEIYFENYTGNIEEINFENYTDKIHENTDELKEIKLCSYNKNTGKTKMFFQDADVICNSTAYDPVSDHLYAGCVSAEYPYFNTGKTENYILDFYKDFEKPKQIIKTKEESHQLMSVIPGEEKLYLWVCCHNTPCIYSIKDDYYKVCDYHISTTLLNENEMLVGSLTGLTAEISILNQKKDEYKGLFYIEGQKLVSFKLLSK